MTQKYTLDMLRAHQRYRTQDGTVVPGVTTVLGVINKPELVKWAHRLGLEGRNMDAVRDDAATVGTLAHAMVEADLRGMEFIPPGNVGPDQLAKAHTALVAFAHWWKEEGWTLEACERQMVSEQLAVGGTADVVATRRGKRALLDIKTSNAVYREHRMQVAAYARIHEDTDNGKIDELWIVRLGKDDPDDVEPHLVNGRPALERAFLAALELYRALNALRRAA